MPYETNPEFWVKDEPRVMGDLIGRPEAIELLSAGNRRYILEAGCGTGYLARTLVKSLVKSRAIVRGCDKEKKMLKYALEREEREPLGIDYDHEDLASLGYSDKSFGKVLCVGVLMQHDVSTIKQILRELYRVLESNAIAVISVTHPYLFTPHSPSRQEAHCWIKHVPVADNDSPEGVFKEYYKDVDGNVFEADVWNHTLSTYANLILSSAFILEKVQEVFVQKEHLIGVGWGDEYGYPAFLQFVCCRDRPPVGLFG